MTKCWHPEPSARLTIETIGSILDILEKSAVVNEQGETDKFEVAAHQAKGNGQCNECSSEKKYGIVSLHSARFTKETIPENFLETIEYLPSGSELDEI